MILPHAARANATEGQVVLRHVQHAIVDRHPARAGAVDQAFHPSPIVVEQVERQWPIPVIDEIDRLIERVIGQHGQQRAKDFVAHQG